ncbi:hypothetical protein [Nonomuraea candida]|nr:hypothetical protein [Nonomuraea candida]
MGNVVDYVTVESLDRRTQQLTPAELDRLAEMRPATPDDDDQ